MYERFSGQARRAMQLAYEEAKRLSADHVGTEHLLLGVLREDSGAVAGLLTACGVDPQQINGKVEFLLPGSETPDWSKLPLTPSATRAMEYAREEAASLNHPWVGPQHLLLGVFREPDSMAAHILSNLGLTLQALRQELAKLPAPENRDWMLQPQPAPGQAAPGDPSAKDLESIVTVEVLPPPALEERPPVARKRWRKRPAAEEEFPKPIPTLRLPRSDAELDLRVVERQLRALRFVVAISAGTLLGGVWQELPGAIVGGLIGCAVVVIRNNFLSAVAASAAGVLGGFLYNPEDASGACALGGLVGLFLGACLGDWRKLRAPPGSD